MFFVAKIQRFLMPKTHSYKKYACFSPATEKLSTIMSFFWTFSLHLAKISIFAAL